MIFWTRVRFPSDPPVKGKEVQRTSFPFTLMVLRGIERALRKHPGGVFLARGRFPSDPPRITKNRTCKGIGFGYFFFVFLSKRTYILMSKCFIFACIIYIGCTFVV